MAADSISQVYTACRSSEILTIIFKLSSAKIMNFFFQYRRCHLDAGCCFFLLLPKKPSGDPGENALAGVKDDPSPLLSATNNMVEI
jgi:hypothetical protein